VSIADRLRHRVTVLRPASDGEDAWGHPAERIVVVATDVHALLQGRTAREQQVSALGAGVIDTDVFLPIDAPVTAVDQLARTVNLGTVSADQTDTVLAFADGPPPPAKLTIGDTELLVVIAADATTLTVEPALAHGYVNAPLRLVTDLYAVLGPPIDAAGRGQHLEAPARLVVG
jgi:hypothetical protein